MAQHDGVELPIRQVSLDRTTQNLNLHLHNLNFHHHMPLPVQVGVHQNGLSSTPLTAPSYPHACHAHAHHSHATTPNGSLAAASPSSPSHHHQNHHHNHHNHHHHHHHNSHHNTAATAAESSTPRPSSSSSPYYANPALSSPSAARAISIPSPTSSSSAAAAAALASAAAATSYKKHKHSRSSYSETSNLSSRNNSVTFRPPKRQMPSPDKTIAVINSSGRQAASLIRVATAVGFRVRAQLRSLDGFIATEVATNPNVTVIVGELYTRTHQPPVPGDLRSQLTGGSDASSSSDREDVTRKGPEPISGVGVNHALISELFQGAQLAFINTTFYGDEIQIGKALLDAAKDAGIEHYVYSSMPDHSAYNPDWPALPLWAAKHKVEDYVRESGIPATFVYTGIYNNNFTSLLYPLFCMELQNDGSFVWQAPFHRDAKLPWLDAEHDIGPAVLQIFKDGVSKWSGKRIALAYEMLTPVEACAMFSQGVGRPVRYIQGPLDIKVKIPTGYRQQLEALEKLFTMGGDDPTQQPPYFGDAELDNSCPGQALEIWEGPRGLEEYAHEAFPVEEQANGLTWMLSNEDLASERGPDAKDPAAADDDDNDDMNDDALEMKPNKRDEEVETMPNKRDEEKWLA